MSEQVERPDLDAIEARCKAHKYEGFYRDEVAALVAYARRLEEQEIALDSLLDNQEKQITEIVAAQNAQAEELRLLRELEQAIRQHKPGEWDRYDVAIKALDALRRRSDG